MIYAVEIKNAEKRDTQVGARTSSKQSTVDTRYDIRLTAVQTNEDGSLSVYFEPFDFQQEVHTLGPGGQTDMTTSNLTIVSKQNGIVMVDTGKGIGLATAQNLKLSVYPRLMSGYMNFEPSGLIKGFDGDLPFVDHWQQLLNYTSNIFYIAFPARPIAVGEAWTNYYNLKSAGPANLDGQGVIQPWGYVREADEATTNGSVAAFSLQMADDYKDISGEIDQGGQQTDISIPKYNEDMSGSFEFDQKRGCLVSMTGASRLHFDLNMVVAGNSGEGHNDSAERISLKLLPQ